ncbi:dicarboxylate/amino acid:cation symporter [Burkholderia sp. FERM BP-3421]|uniref:dicarboxylate/amino acid:cation symporter n=1 Tax=Burkholderia sp. FERM BP-3421 TaxID=1494466 RepID=UPI002360C83D|nr:dicarboxylate/amino acid:cation symporter [Burkholderia sp. FERM BP-3421]WDD95209.1 dicarboxylate/amino acid:cation symporter [Burkholderia sp. FERM BP-3421]
MNPTNRGFSLPLQMIAGLVLGIVCGLYAPGVSAKLGFITTLFGHAIKMVVLPLILMSVTIGTFRAGISRGHLGRTALLSLVFFLVMTLVASALGLGLNLLFRPGVGASLAHTASLPSNLAGDIDWLKFVTDLIPANIVGALAAGNSLPVLVFGVLLGSALAAVEDRAGPLIAVCESFLAALFKLTEWVVAFSPLAIFAALAFLLSSKGMSALTPLLKLLGIAYLGMAILAVLLTLIVKLAGQSPFAVLRQVGAPLILGFTTRSSEITFPLHLKKLTEMGVPSSVASTILPLSYIFNRDGAVLYTALAVGYLADAYHLTWSWPLLLTIAVLTIITIDGAANVPSGAIVAITVILSAIGLPAEAVLLILGIDAFFDMGRTALNVYASTVATTVAMRISGETYDGERGRPAVDGFATARNRV